MRRLTAFFAAVARRFSEERAMHVGASLTYTTLLSLVPFFTMTLALSTAFPVFDKATAALQSFVFSNFLPDARGVEAVAKQIQSFTENAGRLTAIGLSFFAVTAVMLMHTIDEALNRIFRVRRQRALLHRVVIYWALITLGPVLIGGSLSMSTFAIGASLGLLNLGYAAEPVLRLLPFVFTWAALTLLYSVVPFRHVPLRHAIAGAFFAGAAFELAKRGFALYLENFPTYTLIYGAFATIPIFLVWLYVSWAVVLAGAIFTAMLPAFNLSERLAVPGSTLAYALEILAVLARAQGSGRPVSLRRITAQVRIMPDTCEALLDRAAGLGWTARTEHEYWVLARDADALRVADVYRAFVYDAEAVGVPETDFGLSLREYSDRERSE